MSRRTTHSMGLQCSVCGAQLVPDNCCAGESHGSTYQEPNLWAAEHWPTHPCFQEASAGEHRLMSPSHPARCTCGWEAPLGKMVLREFDKHLLDVREKKS